MFNEKIKEVCKLASIAFHVDLSKLIVRMDIKGTSAGQARLQNGELILRLNPEAMQLDPNHVLNDTIPHEIAHLVCFVRPELGDGHDAGWKRICAFLGGTSERQHNVALTPARKKRAFLYQNGEATTELSIIRHNKLQRGTVPGYRTSQADFNKQHFVKEL